MGNFFRGIGAFLYSIVHTSLLSLLIWGVGYVFLYALYDVSLIVFFLLGGIVWALIDGLKGLLATFLIYPYVWLVKDSYKVVILPAIVLFANAIYLLYWLWTQDGIDGWRPIVFCAFLSHEIFSLTYVSIMALFITKKEDFSG